MEKKSRTAKNLTRRARVARRKIDRSGRKISRHADNFLRGRLDNLRLIRKNVILWLLAIAFLLVVSVMQVLLATQNSQILAPADGGTYAEGVVDKITTLNPLFATTESEVAASGLIFSGLFSYDDSNHLRGDLVSTWSTEDGKTWNFKLRENAKWSDGEKITADDVIFTLDSIKNSALGSPLYETFAKDSFAKTGDFALKIELPTAYMSLPYALTFGILPEHILKDSDEAAIRNFMATDFAKNIASGPFIYRLNENISGGQTIWSFSPNAKSAQNSRISALTIRTYASEKDLTNGLDSGEINAAAGISASDAANLKSGQKLAQATLNDGVFAIFNTDAPSVSDQGIRESLRLATDRNALRKVASGKLTEVKALETPIANGIYASVDALKQPDFDAKIAGEKLDSLGWKINQKTHFREKDGQKLTLRIVTIAGTDYAPVAKTLVDEWRKIGIDAQLTEVDPTTANNEYLTSRNYDVLVYDLHLGADPDEFAYWSSTETGAQGLNFANYTNRRADLALNNGRTQTDPAARENRYVDFVKRWQTDVPAIALYQPKYYYATASSVNSLNDAPLTDGSARFREVSDWTANMMPTNTTP